MTSTPQDNPSLREAIKVLTASPSDENKARFYETTLTGRLILGIADVPAVSPDGTVNWEKVPEFQILTSVGPDGKPVILAFSHVPENLDENLKSLRFKDVAGHKVLKMAVDGGFGGIIVDPLGPWAGIPRPDIESILKVRQEWIASQPEEKDIS